MESLKQLHNLGYVHRDIKPNNIIFRRNSNFDFQNLLLIDFGSAVSYKTPSGKHIPDTVAKFDSNEWFGSVNAFKGH